MVTDSEYNTLANQVYNVEPNKAKANHTKVIKEQSKIKDSTTGQSYRVFKIDDNFSNGMQAMAVAPTDSHGKPNTSQMIIAYAGTNSSDNNDLQTDVQSIGLGSHTLTKNVAVSSQTGPMLKHVTTGSQFTTAVEFSQLLSFLKRLERCILKLILQPQDIL